MKKLMALTLFGVWGALAGCEQEGALEQAGEEADEAIDRLQNDGEQTVGEQLDDAADEVRDAAENVQEEVSGN